jgi:CubicO group peptidase (beta-lactamase class C family)
VSWWTKDPKDLRSTVTFRHLLSFTSGFGDGHPGEEMNTRAARKWRKENKVAKPVEGVASARRLAPSACDEAKGDVTLCATWIYENVKLIGTPGQVYSYNSNHLQIAAAVSVAASGLHIQQVIEKYLIKPYGMANSSYPGNCPDFGASLVTTATDYELFMRGLLGYTTLPKAIIEASEEDSTPFMQNYYTLYGDYGFGHFLMCFDSVHGFTQQCRDAKCHMDPGAFGFIPIIDRKYNYYMEVVAAEIPPTGSYPLSGIPEYLAVAIKPHIDAIMAGQQPDLDEFSHHEPKYLSMTVADVNYCADCKLHPEHCD